MVSVGSVSVKVVPDTQNFISKLQRDMDSQMKGAGQRLSSRMTESLARQLNDDVESAFKDLERSNGKRGDEAGKDYGKSYAASFRDQVDKALRDFAGGKSIPLDVDVDDAAVTRLREKLAALQGDKVDFVITADVNTKYATARLDELEKKCDELAAKTPTITPEFNDRAVRIQIAYLEALLDRLGAKRVTVDVDFDDLDARARMAGIAAETSKIAGMSPTITFDINDAGARAKMAFLVGEINKIAAMTPTITIDVDDFVARMKMIMLGATARNLAAESHSIRFDADTASATSELSALFALAESIAALRPTITVDADTGAAASEMAAVDAEAHALPNTVVIDVQAEIAAAAAAIAIIQAQVDALDRRTADVDVDVRNGATIIPILGGIFALVTAIGAAAPAAAAGLAAIGTGIGAAGQGLAAGIVGFSGIGAAIKAVNAENLKAEQGSTSSAKTQISNANAIANAQASLASAVNQANRQQITGAESVADAQRSVTEAVQAASRSALQDAERVAAARSAVSDAIVAANDRVLSAESSLSRAQQSAQASQENLTQARRDAREALEDLQLQLSGGVISEERASYNLAKARDALVKGAASADPLKKWDLSLDVKEAVQNLAEAREKLGDLKEQQADYARTGIEGSKGVVAAQRQVQSSSASVADAQRSLTSAQTAGQKQVQAAVAALAVAQRTQSWDAQDSAASIAKAQEGVVRAVRSASWQQQDAATAIANAQRGLQAAYEKTGAAGADSGSKAAALLAKLSDAGREFVRFWTAEFSPAFQNIGNAVANVMLPGIERGLRSVISLAPLLTGTFVNAGKIIGDTFERIATYVSSGRGLEQLTNVMSSNNRAFSTFGKIGETAVRIVLTLAEAAGPMLERMANAILDGARWFDDFLMRARETGQLSQWFRDAADSGSDILGVLWRLGKGIIELTLALAPLGRFLLDFVVGPIGDFLSWLSRLNPVVLNVAFGAGILLAALVGVGNVLQRLASAFFGKSIAGGLVGIRQSIYGVAGAAKTLRTDGIGPTVAAWRTQTKATADAGKAATTTASQMTNAAKQANKATSSMSPFLAAYGMAAKQAAAAPTAAPVAAPTFVSNLKANYSAGNAAGRAFTQGLGNGIAGAASATVTGVATATKSAAATVASAAKTTVAGVQTAVAATTRTVNSGFERAAVGLSDFYTKVGKVYDRLTRLPAEAAIGMRQYVDNLSKNLDALRNQQVGTPSGRTLDLSSTTALADSSKSLTAIDAIGTHLDTVNNKAQTFGVRAQLAMQSFGAAVGRGVTFAQTFGQGVAASFGRARDSVSLLATRGAIEMQAFTSRTMQYLNDLRRDVGTYRDANGRLHSENGRFLAASSYAQNQWKAVVQNAWKDAQVAAIRGQMAIGSAYDRVTEAGRRVAAAAPGVGRSIGNSLLTGAVVGIDGTLRGLERLGAGIRSAASTAASAGTSGFGSFRAALETGVIRGATAANGALDTIGAKLRGAASAAGSAVTGGFAAFRTGLETQVIRGALTANGALDSLGRALRTGVSSAADLAGRAAVGFGGIVGGVGNAAAGAGRAITTGLGNALLGTKTNMDGFITRSGGLIGALGGPWGLAITGATVALGFLADAHQKAAQRAADQRAAVDNLKGSLDQYSGAVTQATINTQAQQNSQNGLADKARAAGISVDDLARAQLGMGDSLGRVNAQLVEQAQHFITGQPTYAAAQSSMAHFGVTMDDLTQASLGNNEALDKVNKAMFAAGRLTDSGSKAFAGLAFEVINNKQPFRDVGSSIGFLNAQLATASKEWLDAKAGGNEFRSALDGVKGSLDALKASTIDANGAIIGQGAVVDQLNGQLGNVSSTARDAALAQAELSRRSNEAGGAATGAARSMQGSRDAFIASAQQMGLTAQQAQGLANNMGLIPQLITTKFNTLGVAEADQAMGILKGHILDIDNTTGAVHVDGASIAGREQELTGLGFLIQHLPDGTVRLFADTTPIDTIFPATVARINATGATLHIGGDPLPANATTQQVVDYINRARGQLHIDADPLPAGATTQQQLDWINRQWASLNEGARTGQVGVDTGAALQWVRDQRGDILVGANTEDARGAGQRVKDQISDPHTAPVITPQVDGRPAQGWFSRFTGWVSGWFSSPTPTPLNPTQGFALGGIVRRELGSIDRVVGMAAGGVRGMAAGVATTVPPNTPTLIGDRKRDDEAYIPLNNDPRSIAILKAAASAMGFSVVPNAAAPMAAGGVTDKVQAAASSAAPDTSVAAPSTVDPAAQAAAATATTALTGALAEQSSVVTALNPLVAVTNTDAVTLATTTTGLLTPSVQALSTLGLNPLVAQMLGVLFPTLAQYQLETGTNSVLANQALQGAQVATQVQTNTTAANTAANTAWMGAAYTGLAINSGAQLAAVRTSTVQTEWQTALSTNNMTGSLLAHQTFLATGFLPAVQGATGAVSAAFQGMSDFVGARMLDMTTATAAQSRFTIDFVLGEPGLTGAWNSIDAQFALGKHINPPRAGFAAGGHVRGPGTETSDSIPANLSRNEFVVQAAVAKQHMPFLAALNAGQAEAVQAAGGKSATMPGYTKSSRIPGFAQGGAVDAVNRAKVFAAQQNGKPYIWGGVGPAGYDCSGYTSAITNVLRGQNPHQRLGVAASNPWPGFASGLNGFWSVGASSEHTAGTLGGINAESGGSHGNVAFGGPAVGADNSQFPVKAWLPEIGGVFVSGGAGGGAGFDPTPIVDQAFKATYDLINSIPARFGTSMPANGMGQGDRNQTDAVRGQALDKLKSMFATAGMGPLGTGEVMAQIAQAAMPYGWNVGPQWDALLWIMSHESGFNPNAQNPVSTAYGLFQFLDSTWGAYGGAKTSNPLQQSVLGMKYIQQRYGDPIGAKGFWAAHNWYDEGGEATGAGYLPKLTPEPERVLSPQQTRAFNTLVSAISEDDILKAGGSFSDGPSKTFNVYPRENQSELSIAHAVRRVDSFENRIR